MNFFKIARNFRNRILNFESCCSFILGCPSNWFNAGERGCFFFAKDAKIANWYDAQNYCKNLEIGSWLAEIHDQETWTILSNQGKSVDSSLDWWLGASDKDEVEYTIFYTFSNEF